MEQIRDKIPHDEGFYCEYSIPIQLKPLDNELITIWKQIDDNRYPYYNVTRKNYLKSMRIL